MDISTRVGIWLAFALVVAVAPPGSATASTAGAAEPTSAVGGAHAVEGPDRGGGGTPDGRVLPRCGWCRDVWAEAKERARRTDRSLSRHLAGVANRAQDAAKAAWHWTSRGGEFLWRHVRRPVTFIARRLWPIVVINCALQGIWNLFKARKVTWTVVGDTVMSCHPFQ